MADVGQARDFVDVKEDIASNIDRVELYFAASYVENDHEFLHFWPSSEQIIMEFSAICLHLNDKKMSFLMNWKGHW